MSIAWGNRHSVMRVRKSRRTRRDVSTLFIFFLLTSCSSVSQYLDYKAEKHGFLISEVKGNSFTHRTFWKPTDSSFPTKTSVLHVYLDGDGTPWVSHRKVAYDPTPRRPLVLNLMQLDAHSRNLPRTPLLSWIQP